MPKDWIPLRRRVTGLPSGHANLSHGVASVRLVVCPLDKHDWPATVVRYFVKCLGDIFVHGLAAREQGRVCEGFRGALLRREGVLVLRLILTEYLI